MAAENLNRKDLTPLEAAAAYQELLDLGVGSDEIAALAGTSMQQVTEQRSLLALRKQVQRQLRSGAISSDEALMLTQLIDTPERLSAALRNSRAGWSLAVFSPEWWRMVRLIMRLVRIEHQLPDEGVEGSAS